MLMKTARQTRPLYPHPDNAEALNFERGMARTIGRESLLDERKQPDNLASASNHYQPGRLLAAYMLRRERTMQDSEFQEEAKLNAEGWHNDHSDFEQPDISYFYPSDVSAKLEMARRNSRDEHARFMNYAIAHALVDYFMHDQQR